VLEVNGTRHPLQPPGLVVGRGSEADLRINDPGVSRRHAEFLVTTQAGGASPGEGPLHIEVHDMGSTNGITVDGHKVSRAALGDGSRVQIGHTSLVVRLLEEQVV
jgi:pSer/pThr/pTyr-binding forkhead associated (FHA) protein